MIRGHRPKVLLICLLVWHRFGCRSVFWHCLIGATMTRFLLAGSSSNSPSRNSVRARACPREIPELASSLRWFLCMLDLVHCLVNVCVAHCWQHQKVHVLPSCFNSAMLQVHGSRNVQDILISSASSYQTGPSPGSSSCRVNSFSQASCRIDLRMHRGCTCCSESSIAGSRARWTCILICL